MHKNHQTFQKALESYSWLFRQGRASGIGFVLTGHDEIIGLDCDNCIEGYEEGKPLFNQGGKVFIEFWKERGAYLEISPSGFGLRGFVVGVLPTEMKRKTKHLECTFEIYDSTF